MFQLYYCLEIIRMTESICEEVLLNYLNCKQLYQNFVSCKNILLKFACESIFSILLLQFFAMLLKDLGMSRDLLQLFVLNF